MSLKNVKVLGIEGDIYRVEVEDDDLGVKAFSFVMPWFDREAMYRIIATLHQEWIRGGHRTMPELPVIPVSEVQARIEEYNQALRETRETKNEESNIDPPMADGNNGGDTVAGPGGGESSNPLARVTERLRSGPAVEPDPAGTPAAPADEGGV
jgi:hypothetical protein